MTLCTKGIMVKPPKNQQGEVSYKKDSNSPIKKK